MTDEPKPPADTSRIVLTDADLEPDPGLAASEPGPSKVTWQTMTGMERVAYVIGCAAVAIVGLGLLALIAGLFWRLIRAVWGIG